MSLLSAVCTFDGIWFKGSPRPPRGVLPMTVICGSSWAAAGLFAGLPGMSAADAEIGIAAAARCVNKPSCRIGFECANSFLRIESREAPWRTSRQMPGIPGFCRYSGKTPGATVAVRDAKQAGHAAPLEDGL